MKCVPSEGISERHKMLPRAPHPLPTQQCRRSLAAKGELIEHPDTQRLQVKAPGQCISTAAFSAWKTQQTTVCLGCFSYLSKGTCDRNWVWFFFLFKISFFIQFPWISKIYPQCLLFQLLYSTLCLKAWNMNMICGHIFVNISPTVSLRLEN